MAVYTPFVTIQVGDFGIDFSGRRPLPLPAPLPQPKFVQRYIAGGIARPKLLDIAERDWLHANGYAIILTYEWVNTAPNLGAAKGLIDGTLALIRARALEYPTIFPIVIAVDLDSIEGFNITEHEAYVRAFARACAPYPIGIYGDTDIMRRVLDISVLNWRAASSWWSRFLPKPSFLHILQGTQDPTHAYDTNRALAPFNAWLPHWEDTPAPPQESEDMIATNEEAHTLPDGNTYPPGVVKWVCGVTKRHITEEEWIDGYGAVVGAPLTNATLALIPDSVATLYVPAPVIDYNALAAAIVPLLPAPPTRFSGSIAGSINGTIDLGAVG